MKLFKRKKWTPYQQEVSIESYQVKFVMKDKTIQDFIISDTYELTETHGIRHNRQAKHAYLEIMHIKSFQQYALTRQVGQKTIIYNISEISKIEVEPLPIYKIRCTFIKYE